MPAVHKASSKKDIEKKELLEKMDRLFRISPVRVKAQDGSNETVIIEHRIGKEAGYFTLRDLMEKLGFEKEHAEFMKEMLRQIKNPNERKEVTDAHYVHEKRRANRLVSEYRKHVETMYSLLARPLLPAMTFVPVTDREDAFYIQGIVRADDHTLVVGEPEDLYRWTEAVYCKTKIWADLNKRAESQAKALMRFPGLNKDIRHRLGQITQGEIPAALEFKKEE